MRAQSLAVLMTVWLSGCILAPSYVSADIRDINQKPSMHFAPLSSTVDYQKAFLLSLNLLENNHYRHLKPSSIGKDVFDDYVDALDPTRLYFLQSDIDDFAQQRKTLFANTDVAQLNIPYMVFERYRQRANAMNDWAVWRLTQPFDLNGHETLHQYLAYKKEKHPRPQSLREATQYQEKLLIDQIIRLMMSGKSESEAVKVLRKRYQNANQMLKRNDSEDVFDIFMNVFAKRYGPHTNYFSPRDSKNFDINIRLSLEGIGAVLAMDENNVMISQLIAGGPAMKSGKLHIRDKIIGVAQGRNGEMVDIVGWRLDRAVSIIRGKKNSIVRLLIEPADGGAAHEVILKRDKIDLEEQRAHSYIEHVSQNGVSKKIGVVRLPSFYGGERSTQKIPQDFHTTSRDVERELDKLKAAGVNGIIIDLRGNGGGLLAEAVKTASLFIHGPVVSVSDAAGHIREEKDSRHGAVYTEPLVVLIDYNSASASEIFAGAIQDYRRGLIVGSNSFGKGTVQTIVDLDNFVPQRDNDGHLGELKLTIAMFYRVTGDSTQFKGVSPDIKLPAALDLDFVGERAKPYALPWAKIRTSKFTPVNDVSQPLIEQVRQKHVQRMTTNPILQRYQEYIKHLAERFARDDWSLNLAQRRREYNAWKQYEQQYEQVQLQSVPSLASDVKRKKDIVERNQSIKDESDKIHFVPDVALYETLNIFYDFLAAIQKPIK